MGVKFGTEEGTFGPLLRAKFHPYRCNVWPLRGENPQNRPLSKLNNRHFALRAMLPVNKNTCTKKIVIRSNKGNHIKIGRTNQFAATKGDKMRPFTELLWTLV